MGDAEEVVIEDSATPAEETDETTLSDDAILDKYAKDDTETAPADEPAPREVAAGEATPVVEEKPEEKLPDERLDPQELKSVFKRYPSLRQEHYSLAAYKDVFPDIKEAREIRQIFPSKEEASDARAAAEKLLQLDASFRSDPGAFVKDLHQSDPNSFFRLASRLPNEVYNVSPEAYNAYYVTPVINEFGKQFSDYAKANGDEELQAAIDVIAQRLGGGNGAQRQPQLPDNDPRLARLQQFERQEQERMARGSEQFYYTAGDAVQTGVVKEVTDIVERQGSMLSAGAKGEIINRVVAEVGDVLSSDNYLQQRIQFFGRGQQNTQTRDSVVRLMMTKARTVLREKAQEKLDWMTRDILALQEPKRARVATQRRDPGDGGMARGGGDKKRPSMSEASRMSPDEIMDAFSRE